MTVQTSRVLRAVGIDPRRAGDSSPSTWQALGDALGEEHAAHPLAAAVADGSSPAAVLAVGAERLAAVAGADGVRIFEFRDDAIAVPVASWGTTDELARIVSPGGVPLSASTATGRAFRSPDPQRTVCAPGHPDPVMAWLGRLGIQHTLTCPVRLNDSAWGMVALMYAGDEPLPGTEDEVSELAELVVVGASAARGRDADAA